MNKKISVVALVGLLALALAGCAGFQVAGVTAQPTASLEVPLVTDGGQVVAEGIIVPKDSVRVYTRSGGEVAEVLVAKGDNVEKGAVLVRFADREQVEAALAAARLQELSAQQALDRLNENAQTVTANANSEMKAASIALTDAQQALDDLDTDTYQTDLDNARTDVNDADDELEDAQEEWDKNKDLDEDNQTRKNAETRLEDAQKAYDDAVRKRDRLINQMEQAQARVETAQVHYDRALQEWEKVKDGAPKPEDLALAQSQLANATAQVAAAENAAENLELLAPFAGTVVELDAVPGEVLLPNQQVLLLADMSGWYVETTDLSEMDVVKIEEGQPAEVSPDALPDLSLAAEVEEIAQDAGRKGGDVVYTARLLLTETDPHLRWGMTVEVTFQK